MTADRLVALPKVQLHCHLEGTVRGSTFRALAQRHGVDIGVRGAGPIETAYAFETFGEFLLLFAEVCKVLRTPDDFVRVARDYVQDALAEGVAYAELFVSPSVWTFFHRDLDVRAVVAAMRGAFDEGERAHGLRVELIADLTRNFGPERALESAREAVELADLGVIGIGLGGDEARFPPHLFFDAFTYARDAGLRAVVHAGEAAGAASVRSALDDLGAERIGHGVRSTEDPALVTRLAREGIALEICPTSNRLTGAVPAGSDHPLADLERSGVLCVIDSDDPALFGTTLTREYALAAELAGPDAPLRFAYNAIDASFASPERKQALRTALDAFCAESPATRRTS